MLGPTASGKSTMAIELAEAAGAEIFSVDSMQVYRGMDIGTAKPSLAERRGVPHHLIDMVDPAQPFSVAQFQAAGRAALSHLETRGTSALIVGGSGLHYRSLVDPLDFPPTDPEARAELEALDPDEAKRRLEEADPDAASHVDVANPRRVVRALEVLQLTGETPSARARSSTATALAEYQTASDVRAIGVEPGEAIAARVADRVEGMLEAGLMDEVEELAELLGETARQAVGYKELLPVVAGEKPLEEGAADVIRATMALAKRQRTFFRRDPRITWLPWSDDSARRLDAGRRALEEAGWTF